MVRIKFLHLYKRGNLLVAPHVSDKYYHTESLISHTIGKWLCDMHEPLRQITRRHSHKFSIHVELPYAVQIKLLRKWNVWDSNPRYTQRLSLTFHIFGFSFGFLLRVLTVKPINLYKPMYIQLARSIYTIISSQ